MQKTILMTQWSVKSIDHIKSCGRWCAWLELRTVKDRSAWKFDIGKYELLCYWYFVKLVGMTVDYLDFNVGLTCIFYFQSNVHFVELVVQEGACCNIGILSIFQISRSRKRLNQIMIVIRVMDTNGRQPNPQGKTINK